MAPGGKAAAGHGGAGALLPAPAAPRPAPKSVRRRRGRAGSGWLWGPGGGVSGGAPAGPRHPHRSPNTGKGWGRRLWPRQVRGKGKTQDAPNPV